MRFHEIDKSCQNIDDIDDRKVNLHHLELFYYVARYGGIMAACREMPYGIQQPAVSSQLIQLERDLGCSLFQRRPFHLTLEGRRLFEHLAPFFDQLPRLEEVLRGELDQELRLVGLGELMRDHLPGVLSGLRKTYPQLRVRLWEREQSVAVGMVERGEAVLGVSVLETTLPAGLRSRLILNLPMQLIWRKRESGPNDWKGWRKLAKEGRLPALISLPDHELLPRLFQERCRQEGIRWPVSIEASSEEMVVRYAAEGLGIGLCVRVPGRKLKPTMACLPLDDFPSVPIGAFWRGELNGLHQSLVEAIVDRAKSFG